MSTFLFTAWVWGELLASEPAVSRAHAQDVLVLDDVPPRACDGGEVPANIECLLAARYERDPVAAKAALELYRRTGTVAGQLPEQDFDGGYRGQLHLVPRLPQGPLRKHLEQVALALYDFDDFFARLGGAPRFRWRALEVRFFESVGRRTPSAVATRWLVAYNVRGSLFGSEAGVRNTLFHEVFHLNDQARGGWSARALGALFDGIVRRCGEDTPCLTPYTPDLLKVRGGTYYAFQPGNGVSEYAADLARRYYVEQRAVLRGERGPRPFKCGPAENGAAWRLLVDEFFGGVDLVPPCP